MGALAPFNMGKGKNPSVVGVCFCGCCLSFALVGLSVGIWAMNNAYEDQKHSQGWPGPVNCTASMPTWTDTYSENCGSHGDTCTRSYTSTVTVTSPAFSGTRKAKWCGPGFKDTDRGNTMDLYAITGATIPCWYDDDSHNDVKFSDCDEETAGFVVGLIFLSLGLCFACICWLLGCGVLVTKSESCNCAEKCCHSTGKCASNIGNCFDAMVECCADSCKCCRTTEYHAHVEQGTQGIHRAPINTPAGGGGLERQPSRLVRAPSWTDPANVAPPAYGFLGRKPSAAVAQEYNVSRETARDMIDKGIVTPHDIDMQVVQNSPRHDGAKGGVTVHGEDASVTVTSNPVGRPI